MVTVERRAGEALSEQALRDLKAVATLDDREIDVSDIAALPQGWSKHAKRFEDVFKVRKESISLRLDADVL